MTAVSRGALSSRSPDSLGVGGGPGNVRAANPVPEPATMAALGLGAVPAAD